jgi:peptidyl-prolyl cis-trans isomerase SurA
MRFFYAILTAAVVFSSTLPVRPQSANVQLVDGIQAIVHDSIITYRDLKDVTDPFLDLLRQRSRTQEEYQKELDKTLDQNLETLVDNELILHDFQTAGYKAPESIIDQIVEERIRARYGNRTTAIQSLQKDGITLEKYRETVRNDFIIQQMTLKNISSELIISPYKIETYYAEHQDKFKVDDEVKLRMIVLNKSSGTEEEQTRKQAEEILSKLNEGASFAEMASVYSQGSQRDQGGDWGWVPKFDTDGKPVLRKELADVAFALKPGEKSSVIETPTADYLMLVEDRRATHIKPLKDVRDDIEKTLQTEERSRLRKQWIERLKKKTYYKYF